jgi:hypothetical protein
MTADTRRVINLAAAATLIITPFVARAGSPKELTNDQLDRVTAGAVAVNSSAGSQASGVLNLTATGGNSLVTGRPLFAQQPGISSSAGASDGTALAVGSNLAVQGMPPPSSSTSVTTGGTADGNLVINSSFNHTTQGAGGVTFQAGWTFAYGTWMGL